ncbi:hypothetical protein F66182_3302 [Fusarium sp. NRRL 66182]|nr:hypothetical protein F66182_3302 [Fusarium sp. NRRL 66182]
MFGLKASLLLSCLAFASLAPARVIEERGVRVGAEIQPVTFKEIFRPPRDYTTPKTLYGRTAQLPDGSLLATWENYSPEPPLVYFPIYRSTDKGVSWTHISNVTDTQNGWGLRYQPFIYVLPRKIGKLAKGTILVAGNSLPTDLGHTKIDIYASTDKAKSWKFVSSVATGGRGIPNNGETPIWEPFLMVYKDQLVCYYSDQGDPAYAQKLVHKTSKDGVKWNKAVPDVRGKVYTERPGMTTVVQLPNKKWMMTYEYGGGPTPGTEWYPLYYRIADSPLKFDTAKDQILLSGDRVPNASPYLSWSPSGGKNGTLIVTALSENGIFLNTQLGAADAWVHYDVPQPGAYTRHAMVLDDPDWLHVISAGYLGGDNWVTNSVFKLPNLPQ